MLVPGSGTCRYQGLVLAPHLITLAVVSDEDPPPWYQGLVHAPEEALLVLDVKDGVPAEQNIYSTIKMSLVF